MNGDGGKAETDVIESTATDTDTAAKVAPAAETDIERGGRGTEMMKTSHDRDARSEDTEAGAQVERETGTGDTNDQSGNVAGAVAESSGDAVEAGTE